MSSTKKPTAKYTLSAESPLFFHPECTGRLPTPHKSCQPSFDFSENSTKTAFPEALSPTFFELEETNALSTPTKNQPFSFISEARSSQPLTTAPVKPPTSHIPKLPSIRPRHTHPRHRPA